MIEVLGIRPAVRGQRKCLLHQSERRLRRIDRLEELALREEERRDFEQRRRLDGQKRAACLEADDVELRRQLQPARDATPRRTAALDPLAKSAARGLDEDGGELLENGPGDACAAGSLSDESDGVLLIDRDLLAWSLPRLCGWLPIRFGDVRTRG